jgi:hypothetical protein
MFTFSDKSSSKELTDFYFYGLLSIFRKSPKFLLDRSCCLAYFKGVLNQLPRDTEHVRWTPCEDVDIVLEEIGEHAFLFGIMVSPDGDFLGCVGQAEANFLHYGTCVQGSGCALLFWHLQSSLVDLGGLSGHDRSCGLTRIYLGEVDRVTLAII